MEVQRFQDLAKADLAKAAVPAPSDEGGAEGESDGHASEQAPAAEKPQLSEQTTELAAQIIDTFLCETAESLVNLPANMLKRFAKPSSSGQYEYGEKFFDEASEEIYSMSAPLASSRAGATRALLYPCCLFSSGAATACSPLAGRALQPLCKLPQSTTGFLLPTTSPPSAT